MISVQQLKQMCRDAKLKEASTENMKRLKWAVSRSIQSGRRRCSIVKAKCSKTAFKQPVWFNEYDFSAGTPPSDSNSLPSFTISPIPEHDITYIH